jgi:pteridine reductase
MDIAGRTALITGGARRVGRAITLGLARAGADVVIDHSGSDAEAEEVADLVRAEGRRAAVVRADVASAAGRHTMIETAMSRFGRLDILINNASLFERIAFDEITEADFDRVIGVNLRGPFFLCQAAAARLREQNGVIINIADLSAIQAWPTFAHHAISKSGLMHLSRVLARALAPDVRVNCILPGTVLPPANFEGEDYAGGRDRRVTAKEGSPDDVVDALLWLIGADFVTGQTLIVDGGRTLL